MDKDKVEFENNDFLPKHVPGFFPEIKPKEGSKIAQWLIKQGLAKSPTSANIIVTVTILLVLAIAAYFFFYGLTLPFGLSL